MFYRALRSYNLKLKPKEEKEFDATKDFGFVLTPSTNDKIYIHWLDDAGKLQTTYTLIKCILVKNKFKLINGSNESATVNVIEL